MADNGIQDVVKRLELELEKEGKGNKSFNVVAGIFVGVIALYLIWLSSQLGLVLQPNNLAEAAAGAALDAAPQVSAHMRELAVDGAPNLAQAASQAAIDMVPSYRAVLEDEMKPVIDEVSAVMASTALDKMVAAGNEGEDVDETMALQEAADAAVARLDAVLDEALDTPMEKDDRTPRQMIELSLDKFETVDRGLKRLARGSGDQAERELVMAWLNVLQQYGEEIDGQLADQYKAEGPAPE